jgi:hypothetical protein
VVISSIIPIFMDEFFLNKKCVNGPFWDFLNLENTKELVDSKGFPLPLTVRPILGR